jgi:hypothetical protein
MKAILAYQQAQILDNVAIYSHHLAMLPLKSSFKSDNA